MILCRSLFGFVAVRRQPKTFALHDRPDPLFLQAAKLSSRAVPMRRQKSPLLKSICWSCMIAIRCYPLCNWKQLALQKRGMGWQLAAEGRIGFSGQITYQHLWRTESARTCFGCKQEFIKRLKLLCNCVDRQAIIRLRGAKLGMTLNLGGLGSTAVAPYLGDCDLGITSHWHKFHNAIADVTWANLGW